MEDVNRGARVVFGYNDYGLNEIGNIIYPFSVVATDGVEPTDPQIIPNEQCGFINYSEIENQNFTVDIRAKLNITTNSAFSTFAVFLIKLKNGSSILLSSISEENLIVSGADRIANIDFTYNNTITTYSF